MTSAIGPAWPRTVMSCPVDGCRWQMDADPPTLSDGVYVDPRRYAQQAMAALEARAAEHMDSHSAVEFLTTIARLNGQLAVARTLLSPEDWAKVEGA